MGWGTGNIGGGAGGLNFKVVGNPQPANPKENMIWVDTDRINTYYFSATQPEGMAEYDVWFPTGKSSTVAFSATKRNPIMVYPISAKQYIDGSLVEKTAKSYQGGEWVEWFDGTYLYNQGDICEEITGGYTEYSSNSSGDALLDSDGMHFTCIRTGGSWLSFNGFHTSIKINVSKYKALHVEGTLNANATTGYAVGFGLTNRGADFEGAVARIEHGDGNGDFSKTLDISNVEGEYYFTIRCSIYSGSSFTANAEIYKIWLE